MSFHLRADRYLVTKQWLASQLDEQLRKTGYIHYGHFIGSMQVRGVTKYFLFWSPFLNGTFHIGTTDPSLGWGHLQTCTTSWFWSAWISRVLYHGFIAYFYYSTGYITSKRTNISRGIWIISSLLWVLTMSALMAPSAFFGYTQDGTWLLIEFLWSFPFMLSSLLILVNHTFFPETVLISYEQIHRARQLYKQLDLSQNVIKDLGVKTVKSYIDGLPSDLMQ